MTEIVEYQVARLDGTVLRSALVPAGQGIEFLPEPPGFEICGEFVTRYRVLPAGEWTVTARYPDGFQSTPELPGLSR